ncbi:hypothetical protein CEXT_646301 [Caerostris extrusa]|uniref:Uncharacterized protein n=1 Tax=Caerostris extrusa TaxID=172846 RepID=A0AAV4TTP2_CAEEX|nr:hypothetical protein CEXT_646301 [Caerostris extrusa]
MPVAVRHDANVLREPSCQQIKPRQQTLLKGIGQQKAVRKSQANIVVNVCGYKEKGQERSVNNMHSDIKHRIKRDSKPVAH